MPSPTEELYAASCNPPRQARPRANLVADDFSDEVNVDDDTEEDLPAPALAQRKRGRKPAIASRSAREAQRKLNHSIIEKARRTRINEALSQLRHLVPEAYAQSDRCAKSRKAGDELIDEDEDPEYETSKRKKGNGREREFKLEILVRTVAFVEDLISKVETLEARQDCGCQQNESASVGKRKRQDYEISEDDPLSMRPRLSVTSALSHERLPSISSWLPEDSGARDISPTYLPSPPSSTQFQPITALQMPPQLLLDPPSPTGGMYAPQLRSREENAVVSLLVNMSNGKSNPVERKRVYPGGTDHNPETVRHRLAQTPASFLGIY